MSDNAPTAGSTSPSTGPVLSYDVPQEVSYSGQSLIELQLDTSYFIASSQATATERPS